MAHCFRCGTIIPPTERHIRRRVRTGESQGRTYGKGKIQSINTSFGIRIVCRECAREIDWEPVRTDLIWAGRLLMAFMILALALLIVTSR